MSGEIFKIRRALLIPFAINVVLLFALLCLSLFFKGSALERIVLAAVFVPTVALFIEAAGRMAVAGDQGLVIRKWMRKRELRWDDITHIGCLTIRRKVYLLLTTTKGFHILSNAYGRFPALVKSIVDRAGADKAEEEARRQIENPLENRSDPVSMWVAVVVIAAIIAVKILSA
ncbi:MAG: hypothetical protein A4E68_00822 [Syntrophaceae bacterium PtaB.Bin095]|jgi:hypothetical protein|nr:MAG: hypothetical protein A4E68_00822 [Syntrophaceae bacterium PtaB.Bin095]